MGPWLGCCCVAPQARILEGGARLGCLGPQWGWGWGWGSQARFSSCPQGPLCTLNLPTYQRRKGPANETLPRGCPADPRVGVRGSWSFPNKLRLPSPLALSGLEGAKCRHHAFSGYRGS